MSDFNEYTIFMVGTAGLSKALTLIEKNTEMLEKRYSKRYLNESIYRLIKRKKEALDLVGSFEKKEIYRKIKYIVPCEEDGVFGALWQLGEELKMGLKVNLQDIPIDQSVIEICDYMDINPYETDSSGAYVMASETPGFIACELKKMDLSLKLIGYTDTGKARIVYGSTNRYLTKRTN